MLIAMAIFGTMLAAAFMIFSSSLQTKRGEDLKLGLQQNLRAAMQVISQDLRSAGVMHLYNQSPCTNNVCSNNTQVAIIALTGINSSIASTSGSALNATQTSICDASQFQAGDIAVRYNGTAIATNASNVATSAINTGFNTSQILQISSKTERSAPKAACTASSNDTLVHNTQAINSATDDTQSYVFKANLLTYRIQPDEFDSSRTALYRLSGLGTLTTPPAIAAVAYDIKSLKIAYGIRSNQTTLNASRLVFYDTLEDAVTNTLGATVASSIPGTAGRTYIGGYVTSVRITLTGESATNLPNSNTKATFSLSETVDLRN